MTSIPDTASDADPTTDLLRQAMQAQQQRQLDEADRLYRQVLVLAPQQPDALHLMGVLAAQRGDYEAAHDWIWQAIIAHPNEAMFHNNLANVCVERGLVTEAEPLYVRAIELDGSRLDALSNLGLLLSRTGRPGDAETLLRRAVELAPSNPDFRQNLANLLLRQGRDGEAVQQCYEGLVVAPRSGSLRTVMVMAYTAMGLKDKAAEVLHAWIAAEPDNPFPRHHLPACTGQQVPDRASDAYVVSVFDGFARSFDAKLADLSYRAPELAAAEVARRLGEPTRSLKVLDVGCGTGLCGPLLAPWARHLTGVDLSEGMLRKAVARALYDDLILAELVAYLQNRPAAFDLLVSADTLCYFGTLGPFAEAARQALHGDGTLVFTVEALPDGAPQPDFVLQGHGRYSHARPYVESSLRAAGLVDVQTQAVVLRNEAGKPVDGWLVSARTPLNC
jgi:predicted TPR repeat methyltransferase